MKENKLKLPGLNLVRFFAFFWVFCYHIFPKQEITTTSSVFQKLTSVGYLGVDLFFVLSSFLLTYLGLHEKQSSGNFSSSNFLIRRALRIMPLYFFVTGFSFLCLPFLGRYLSESIILPQHPLLYFFFLSNFDLSNSIYALKFLWSVSVEEQFYWTWALLLLITGKRFLFVTITFLVASCFAYAAFLPSFMDHPFSTLRYLVNFGCGGLFAILFFRYNNLMTDTKLVLALLLISAVLLFFIPANSEFLLRLITAILFGSVLIFAIRFCSINVQKLWVYRLFDRLGIYTYGLYVYSGFVLTVCDKFLSRNIFKTYPVLFALVNLALLIPLAIASYHFFELRFLKYSKKFSWQPRVNRPVEVND